MCLVNLERNFQLQFRTAETMPNICRNDLFMPAPVGKRSLTKQVMMWSHIRGSIHLHLMLWHPKAEEKSYSEFVGAGRTKALSLAWSRATSCIFESVMSVGSRTIGAGLPPSPATVKTLTTYTLCSIARGSKQQIICGCGARSIYISEHYYLCAASPLDPKD
jgi:hypothetical protein